jgi:hypothetical protein
MIKRHKLKRKNLLDLNCKSPFKYNGKIYENVTHAMIDLEKHGVEINDEILLRLLANKFASNQQLQKKLMDTGDIDLSDGKSDMDKKIAKMLMSVREGLKKPLKCRLFNGNIIDGQCNEMACEFCDKYYDEKRKQWWWHPESDCYVYESVHAMKCDPSADDGLLVNVDDKIHTRVVNVKHDEYDVYIGRKSIYGNPFTIGKDGDRREVLIKFRKYLDDNVKLLRVIKMLKGKRLGCHCAPLDCHGDIIAETIENIYR